MKKAILFIQTLLTVVHLYAYNKDYYFETLDINKGLSNSYVTSVLSDSRGVLWIGTCFGLNCYNGHEMKSYFHHKEVPFSLAGSYIFFIAEDARKEIWVSTMNGLVKYDKNRDGFLPPVENQKVEAYSFFSTDNEILFGGDNKLYRYSYQEKSLQALSWKGTLPPPSRIIQIYEWKKGVFLLIFEDSGAYEYHLDSGHIRKSVYSELPPRITATYMDSQKNLYVSSFGKGLLIFDHSGKQKYHLTSANSTLTYDIILSMAEKDGKLWMSTDGGGINIMDMKQPLSMTHIGHVLEDAHSLPTNSITCLYKDQQENMWAGSVRKGLFEIKEVFIRTYKSTLPENAYGLSNATVSSLCQDQQGFLWVGTDGGGINRYDPGSRTFKHFPSTNDTKVVSIVEYSASELLLLLYNDGVYRFDKTTGKKMPFTIAPLNKHQLPLPSWKYLYQVSDHHYLFLAERPYLYNKQNKEMSMFKTNENLALLSSLRLVGVVGESVYLVHRNHLLKANLKTDSISSVLSVKEDEIVQVVSRTPNGVFWIGTDHGLRCFHPDTRKYEVISTNLFDRVSAIIPEDETRIWIGASNTLFSYHTQDHKFLAWGESDGFLPNELSDTYLSLSTGKFIYMGGIHGLVRIDKSVASSDHSAPDIKLTDVVLNGVSIWNNEEDAGKKSSGISIPWDYNLLQIKIISIDKDLFRRKLFRYTLFNYSMQGGESKIVETYNPTLSLDMLSPGEYSIHASCYTESGIWSSPQQVLYFVITPPWYQDYRIWLGVAMILITLLIGRIRVLIRRKEEKIKWEMAEVIQKADQEKIHFLIHISHELRTPLTLIYAPLKKMVEKTSKDEFTSEAQHYFKRQLTGIQRAADQMKNIINMTLDIHRVGDEKGALRKKPHALNEWIRSIASEFECEMEFRQITLNDLLDETITLVEFDDVKCESVLSNLLMNALKFSPDHSIITLSSMETGTGVRVCVSDQGIGLGNIDPTLLFTRFYQGEHNRQGSGIGLSYAKTLIEKQGGTVGAFNNKEGGATFYFELPFQNKTEEEPAPVNTRLVESSFAPINEVPKEIDFPTDVYSVVIAEDNAELRQYLTDSLSPLFRKVYSVSDGEEAWQIVTAKMPDLIISDIMMPRMDGYELCKQVKSDPMTCHTPVILLTARCDAESTTTGYRLGADAYVPKPFDLDFLVVILQNQLRNRARMKQRYVEAFIRVADEVPMPVVNRDEEFLLKFNKLILEHLSSRELSIKFLTEQMNMSRTPLYNKIKALTNVGVNDYINRMRIEKASELLLHSEQSISEISDAVGFEYQRYFSTLFKQIKGMTPSQYRQSEAISAKGDD